MKVALIARSTLYKVPGGDTVQIKETATNLQLLGIDVTVVLSDQLFNTSDYDLLHFFNIIRPADILKHIDKSDTPFVVSPILVDYSEFDQQHRKGFSGQLFRYISADSIEYLKALARWLKRKDNFPGITYLFKGHRECVNIIIRKCSFFFPNSETEINKLQQLSPAPLKYIVVPNGVNTSIFTTHHPIEKDKNSVLCVARFEGLKNQLTLIRALNNTEFHLTIIGSPSANHKAYYEECKRIAATNITFVSHIPQEELVSYYHKSKVHILPSWFETCGLSSLEAATADCNIVVTDKGYTRDYFGTLAFYCDPASPDSIRKAVMDASAAPVHPALKKLVLEEYTWKKAAQKTIEGYKIVLKK